MEDNYLVKIEVRNDKDRGILVLTICLEEMSYNVHFFKYHHQPIDQHPEQIQRIVRQARPTIRTKSVFVDITPFSAIYWNVTDRFFEFKGVKLNSSENQIHKAQETKISKEIGAIKRKLTNEAKKKDKQQAIREKLANDEKEFQLKRARRVKEAMEDQMETDTIVTQKK